MSKNVTFLTVCTCKCISWQFDYLVEYFLKLRNFESFFWNGYNFFVNWTYPIAKRTLRICRLYAQQKIYVGATHSDRPSGQGWGNGIYRNFFLPAHGLIFFSVGVISPGKNIFAPLKLFSYFKEICEINYITISEKK